MKRVVACTLLSWAAPMKLVAAPVGAALTHASVAVSAVADPFNHDGFQPVFRTKLGSKGH